jgi:hypothetical protein
MPIKVTFDSNTFGKVSRPTVYNKDRYYSDMVTIHEALKRGDVQGIICETTITLEGIGVDHRAAVFGGTVTRSSIVQVSEDTLSITITPEQPDRCPVHPKQVERFLEAFGLGIRLLGAPRIAMPRADEQLYAIEDPAMVGERLDRFYDLTTKIEARGLGSRRAQLHAVRLARGHITQGPWFTALGAAQGIYETRQVARAVAEWADGDSVGAHYGYGNDIFCTYDAGRAAERREEPSVLDSTNRAWLTQEFGIRFASPQLKNCGTRE